MVGFIGTCQVRQMSPVSVTLSNMDWAFKTAAETEQNFLTFFFDNTIVKDSNWLF